LNLNVLALNIGLNLTVPCKIAKSTLMYWRTVSLKMGAPQGLWCHRHCRFEVELWNCR